MPDYGSQPASKPVDFEKDPDSVQTLNLNWAVELDGETISTSVWDGDGLTLSGEAISGSGVSVLASGGSNGSIHEVKNTITTSGGQTFAKRLVVRATEL
jgi:hypothetical protein